MKKAILLMTALTFLASGCGSKESTVEHTVTFECNYSNIHGPVQSICKVKDGEKVSKPTVVRTDYDLLGWYKDNNTFQVEFDFNEVIKADLTLYAKWSQKKIELENVKFLEDSIEVKVGESHDAIWAYYPSNTTESGFNWSTADASIATVDNDGKVTGVKAGVTTVTVTSAVHSNLNDTITVTVIEND